MFRPIPGPEVDPRVTIEVDGRAIRVRAGLSLALALMEAEIVPLRRTPVSGAPRSPLCLMGVCFECLCEVDGGQNVQSCMVEVADGMRVRLSTGARRMGAGS
jgi:predicted molibdopterin-dependent oxidoreductase YjgC